MGVVMPWSTAASHHLQPGTRFPPQLERGQKRWCWPRSVLLLEAVPCALTASPAPRCGSPCHPPGPRAGPRAGSPAQGRLPPPPPWAAEPPGSLWGSQALSVQGQGSGAGRYVPPPLQPRLSKAPATLPCRVGPHPVWVPPVSAFASSIPGLPQPLSCPSQAGLGQPPPLLALQSHSPCSVAPCCWHFPGCAQEGPQPTAGGGLWADSPASAPVAWDLDGKKDREGNSQGSAPALPCSEHFRGSEPGLVLLHRKSCSSCACCCCQARGHSGGAGLDPQGTSAFLRELAQLGLQQCKHASSQRQSPLTQQGNGLREPRPGSVPRRAAPLLTELLPSSLLSSSAPYGPSGQGIAPRVPAPYLCGPGSRCRCPQGT